MKRWRYPVVSCRESRLRCHGAMTLNRSLECLLLVPVALTVVLDAGLAGEVGRRTTRTQQHHPLSTEASREASTEASRAESSLFLNYPIPNFSQTPK